MSYGVSVVRHNKHPIIHLWGSLIYKILSISDSKQTWNITKLVLFDNHIWVTNPEVDITTNMILCWNNCKLTATFWHAIWLAGSHTVKQSKAMLETEPLIAAIFIG